MVLALQLLQSCGSENDLSFITRTIIHSSELLNTPMQSNEYIVAFKAGEDYRGKWLSPKNENRYNTVYLSSALNHQIAMSDFQMFGRIPMTKQKVHPNPINTNFLYTQPSQPGKQPDEMILTNIIFRSSKEARETLEKWSNEDAIWFAEPNYINKTFQNPYVEHLQDYQNATGSNPQWYHSEIKLLDAFNHLSNADIIVEPVIAILDTGVQTDHDGLAGQIWENDDASIGKAGCANDINGCNTGAAFRYSFGNGDITPKSEDSQGKKFCESGGSRNSCSHGTHVAGIAAGNHNYVSGERAISICPVCKILAIKAVPTDGEQTIADSAIIAGLKYISNFRSKPNTSLVRVINMSLGKSIRSRAVTALIQHLFDNLNILVIAAAGNEDTNVQSYPASLPSVVAVSSVQEASGDRTVKSKFSNFGTWVDIAAPGYQIPSTESSSDSLIIKRNGTSMAAPVVAGVAGLILSQEPNISAQELKNRLVQTTNTSMYRDYDDNFNYFIKPQGELTRVPLLGTGLLDASAAVTNSPSISPVPNPEVGTRVTPTCGCLSNNHEKNPWMFLWFLIPLSFICFSPKKREPKNI